MNADLLKTGSGVLLALLLLALLAQVISPPLQEASNPIIFPRTRDVNRTAARQAAIAEITQGLQLPTDTAHAKQWRRVLNMMKWTAYQEPDGVIPLKRLLELDEFPDDTRRLLFETIHAVYPTQFSAEMTTAVNRETDPRRFCMAASWLLREADHAHAVRHALSAILTRRFPEWPQEPRFEALHAALQQPLRDVLSERPPLRDLLDAPFDHRPVIYSFQRLDRAYQGRAVVRKPDGTFVRDTHHKILSVAQLARAVNDLPGTITNGNSPQGIFEVRSFGRSRIAAIGPTPTIVLGLPGEYDKTWTSERYRALLPESWHGYWPIYEAWWAGQAGRFEIIAHGTTKDPHHWREHPFYPNTPSHGCLTALETWDSGNGQRLISEQARLVDALKRAGGTPGWLVLIVLDAQRKHVTPLEVQTMIQR